MKGYMEPKQQNHFSQQLLSTPNSNLHCSRSDQTTQKDDAGTFTSGHRPQPIAAIPEHCILFMAARYGYTCMRDHFISSFSQVLLDAIPGEVD